MDEKKCAICREAYLTKKNTKYCSHCSSIFYHLKDQVRFAGLKIEDIEEKAREYLKRTGRSNCGRKPSFVKIRIIESERPEAIAA